ncbi:MAG: putative undecaprenyl-phosphate N-acetylglucosaminyl 1-phosphate transferase [Catillopecten margaritatus gill symbiont]|uniref:Undecaprenyl-phosphate N-acetylglucosaminyl 1-phosphate transferase n=1 Tax=Catillopecten margaritatus gill symbiont TaxID=3083288 RepID=A0AAU6PGL8_9GAMM
MQVFLVSFIFSLGLGSLIVVMADKKQWFLNRHDLTGVQKFHHHPTPHVGGLAVFLSLSMGCFLLPVEAREVLLPVLLVAVPVFVIGLIEDFTADISPLWRLIFIFIAISVSFFYFNVGVSVLGFVWVDDLLSYPLIALVFTLLVVGGAVNSINVIDGYNGLMSGYAMLVSTAMAVVAYQLGDMVIVQLNLLLVASLLGFFVLNFPSGKLFMGDGGAYFIGFMLSMIGLIFVSRHAVLSNWFVLALLMYPMYELLFSIYRKKVIHGTLASQPDAFHLHMLIHKAMVVANPNGNKVWNNSKTSPYLWVLSLVSIVPAMFWYDDKVALISWACLFMVIYTLIYRWVK